MKFTGSPSGASNGMGFCIFDEGGGGFAQAFDAAVRDGNALAQSGGTEFFACEQAVEHLAARDMQRIFEQ